MALETMSGEKRMTLETSGLMSTLFPLSSFEFVVNFWRSRRSRDLTQRSEKKKQGWNWKMTPAGKMRDTLLLSKHKKKEGQQENIKL